LIETIIDATGVWKRYDAGRHKIDALKGIDLTVLRGEVVAVMGPSGCGKTTLLNCLSGLDVIDSGTIKIAGRDLKDLTDNQRTDFRAREMGLGLDGRTSSPSSRASTSTKPASTSAGSCCRTSSNRSSSPTSSPSS